MLVSGHFRPLLDIFSPFVREKLFAKFLAFEDGAFMLRSLDFLAHEI